MKKLISLVIFIFSFFSVNALPGFSPYIADVPGDYVFYRDYSFNTETYIGFLYYGSSYQAKLITLEDKKNKTPEKSVEIYFTVDESKDFLEFTGEKVISLPNSEDILLVNYLQDLVYEFSKKRIKAQSVDKKNVLRDKKDFLYSGFVQNENLEQFGGEVKIIYDWAVPLFNIKAIKNYSDQVQFVLATVGRISTSENNDFENFKGFGTVPKKSKLKLSKNAKKNQVNFENLTLTLDNQWNQAMENVWFLGEKAVVVLSKISLKDKNLDFIFRQMLINPQKSYYNWNNFVISDFEDSFTIDATVFDAEKNKNSKNLIKVVKNPENESEYFLFNSSIYFDSYLKNEKYFSSIRESFNK